MDNKVRVRYAPSPTGHLHIGNARTALFNYLFARHHHGEFVIRIEDTDTKRNMADGESSQLNNLQWLGIDWDEGPDKPGKYGPYRQSERRDIYAPLIQSLLDQDLAYKCYCTEEELEAAREQQRANGEMPHYPGTCAHLTKEQQEAYEKEGREYVVRFRVPEDKTYAFHDIVKGDISFESRSIGGDFIIQKRDGMPTYNFAVVVDDHMMDITHVLRGDDHIANTPKQLMIYEAFGWEAPEFGHMTLITNGETGKKLSKRDETILQFIEQYRDLGYLPEAMFNFIALLGWSPKGEEEIFDKASLIEQFDAERLSKSPAAFDAKKLEWINNHYVKALSLDKATALCLPYLEKEGRIEQEPSAETMAWVKRLVALYQQQMSYGAEIVLLTDLFFSSYPTLGDDEKAVLAEETAPTVLAAFRDIISSMTDDDFIAEHIFKAIKQVQKETGIKGRFLFMPIRVATTGVMHGPELPDTLELLGRTQTIAHLNEVLS